MKPFVIRALLLLALGSLSLACSGNSSPTNPPSSDYPTPQGSLADPIPESLRQPGTTLESSLALVAGTIDFDAMRVDLEQHRVAAAAGDTFDLDATDFFMHQPCVDCVRVAGIGRTVDGDLRVDVALRHPFGTESGRRDLYVFDVRGILILPGTTPFDGTTADLDGDGTIAPTETIKGNVGLVTNADGYTTRFDGRAEDAGIWGAPKNLAGNLNPFKRYFVDPTSSGFDPMNPAGHNVVPLGAEETQSWVLKAPTGAQGPIPFVFVVDAAYGAAGSKEAPAYLLPEFNRKEAWSVEAAVSTNTLAGGNVATSAIIDVEVKDWQQGATVAPAWPPSESGQVRGASGVAQVTVDIPGVNSLDTVTAPAGGTGTDADPLHYAVTVTNNQGAPQGSYTALVAVRDQLAFDAANAPGALPGGITRGTPMDIRDYTTYVTVPITVGSPSGVDLEDPLPNPVLYVTTAPVSWSGSVAGVVGNFGWAPDGGPGFGNLWRLDPNGTKTNLTNFYRSVIRKPTLNYAATKVAFAAKVGDGSAPWQIYTMDVNGNNLSNLSRNTYNDFDPDWLPDGRIVFASDRLQEWNDPYHLDTAPQLFTMSTAGTQVKRLTYSPSGDYWPVVLKDGRISFRRWDNLRVNVEKEYALLHTLPYGFPEDFWMSDVNGCTIWVINPDGTVPDLLYGSHLNRNRRSFNDHSELPDGRLLAVSSPFSSTYGAGTLAILDTTEYDNIEFPDYITEPEAAAASPSPYGRYRFPAALADGRAVATFAPGPVFDDGTNPEPDFGLVVVNNSGERRTLVDTPGVWEWMPVEVRARPTPVTLPDTDDPNQDWGLIAAGNVFLRDAREPESKDPQPIPFPGPGFKVRFYQGIVSTSELLHDNPEEVSVVRPHQYLGEAPVASDGSFAAMVPSHVPLTWQLVDAQDKVIVTERFYTTLEGGETRTCQGCHAPQRPGAFTERDPDDFVAMASPADLRPN